MDSGRSEPLRVFVCAGEASGDALGASLIRALHARVPELEAAGMGGPRMAREGFKAWRDAREVNVVGFVEVLRHLPRLFRLVDALAVEVERFRPQVVVLVDIPDFNVRLAKRLRSRGLTAPIAMYVGPSVWAWRSGRVRTFRRFIHRMMVLFPFELPVWVRGGVDAVCVGHPLLDEISTSTASLLQSAPAPAPASARRSPVAVSLLPGSRRSEVDRLFGVMLAAAEALHARGLAERFVVPLAPTLDEDALRARLDQSSVASLTELFVGSAGERRARVASTSLAIVASGTATLEVGLLGVPQIIVYRTHWLSYAIGRALAKVRFLGLPNLILGREVVSELLQGRLTAEALAARAAELLADDGAGPRARLLALELRERMGEGGAAERAAAAVLSMTTGTGTNTGTNTGTTR